MLGFQPRFELGGDAGRAVRSKFREAADAVIGAADKALAEKIGGAKVKLWGWVCGCVVWWVRGWVGGWLCSMVWLSVLLRV